MRLVLTLSKSVMIFALRVVEKFLGGVLDSVVSNYYTVNLGNCGCCGYCECTNGVLTKGTEFHSQTQTYTYSENTQNLGPYCSFTYIRGEQTITIPGGISLPVVVVLQGSVNDDLLVNGQVIDGYHPSGFGSCNGSHAVNVCFTANSRTFTLATKDNYGYGMSADILIRFCSN